VTIIKKPHHRKDAFDLDFTHVVWRVKATSLILITAIFSASLIFGTLSFSVSFLVGAVMSYLNFIWLKQGIDQLVKSSVAGLTLSKRTVGAAIFNYFLRYILIGLLLYVIVRFNFFSILPVFLGLFIFVKAVLWECLYQGIKGLNQDIGYGAR